MKVKQIFSAYDFHNNNGLAGVKFCPVCGSQLQRIEEGGQKRPVCPGCGFVYYKNPAPAVSVLITENNRVLLGQRGPASFLAGKWCLPCGFIEYDEDFLTAAIREVKEETGLTVALQSIINVTANFLVESLHSLVVVFLARVTAGTPCAGDDIISLAWFDLADPLPEMAFDADTSIIARFHAQQIDGLPIDTDFSAG